MNKLAPLLLTIFLRLQNLGVLSSLRNFRAVVEDNLPKPHVKENENEKSVWGCMEKGPAECKGKIGIDCFDCQQQYAILEGKKCDENGPVECKGKTGTECSACKMKGFCEADVCKDFCKAVPETDRYFLGCKDDCENGMKDLCNKKLVEDHLPKSDVKGNGNEKSVWGCMENGPAECKGKTGIDCFDCQQQYAIQDEKKCDEKGPVECQGKTEKECSVCKIQGFCKADVCKDFCKDVLENDPYYLGCKEDCENGMVQFCNKLALGPSQETSNVAIA